MFYIPQHFIEKLSNFMTKKSMNIKVKSLIPTGKLDFAVKEEIGSAQKKQEMVKNLKDID